MVEILYLLGNIFLVLAYEIYFENTLKRRMNKYITLCIMIVIFELSDYVLVYFKGGLKVVVYEILTFGVIYFLYSDTLKKKIIQLFIISVFNVICEVVAYVVLYIFNTQSNNIYLMGYVLSKILMLLVSRIVILIKLDKNDYMMDYKTLMSIVVIPLLSIIMVVLYHTKSVKGDLSLKDVMFYGIVFVINYINVIQYKNVQRMLKLQKNNELLMEQKRLYLFQYEQSQKNMDAIRTIKHNIKNDYISQLVLLDNKKYDELERMYKQKISDVDSIVRVSQTGNKTFDTIINYKLSEIVKEDVKFDLNISVPKKLDVDEEDIILVIGNLLDNVREAFEMCDEKEKTGKMKVLYDKGILYIETENTFNAEINRDKDGKIKSIKKNTFWHGIGLTTIDNIVKKYNGKMVVADDNNCFTVKIIMEI